MYGTSLTAYDAVGSRWRGERSWNATNSVLVASLPFGFGLLSQPASASATASSTVTLRNIPPLMALPGSTQRRQARLVAACRDARRIVRWPRGLRREAHGRDPSRSAHHGPAPAR